MNDLQKELQELKAKVADLESRIVAEPIKWQPKGGGFWVSCDGEIEEVDSSYEASLFGTERQTREKAQRASVEMRKFNRLLALRDELCGDNLWMCWLTSNDRKYFIYFSHEHYKWNLSSDGVCQSITPYFTTLELAQKACDMLNSGEVEL